MAGKMKLQGEVVLEYMSNDTYKDLPSKTLARLIYNQNKALFPSEESVRTTVRAIRGKSGSRKRRTAAVMISPELPNGHYANKFDVPNPFNLPDSDDVEWLPFDIAKSITRLLILSDVHLPYHNIQALTLALKYGKDNGANGVLLNGDILDFYGLSRYEKDPRKRKFSDELQMGRDFIALLRREFDGIPIYFKVGNHEARYESFLRLKAPELLGISEFQIDNLLRFGEHGVELITDDRIIRAGKLSILHGHEFGRSIFSPVNPARGAYMRSKENVIVGHHHQTSSHMEKSLNGDVIGAWSTGCLCEMHPAYARINKWNHGFAFVEIESDGTFEVSNMSIINGKVR